MSNKHDMFIIVLFMCLCFLYQKCLCVNALLAHTLVPPPLIRGQHYQAEMVCASEICQGCKYIFHRLLQVFNRLRVVVHMFCVGFMQVFLGFE